MNPMSPTRTSVPRAALLPALFSLLCTGAGADILVTAEGEQIEIQGSWEVRGRLVVFTNAQGNLSSMRLNRVDLEASAAATKAAAEATRKAAEEREEARRQAGEKAKQRTTRHPAVRAEATDQNAPVAILNSSKSQYTASGGTDPSEDGEGPVSAEEAEVQYMARVAWKMSEIDLLAEKYDMDSPAGVRQAAPEVRRLARELKEVANQRAPSTPAIEEVRKGLREAAEKLETFGRMAATSPEAALRWWAQQGN